MIDFIDSIFVIASLVSLVATALIFIAMKITQLFVAGGKYARSKLRKPQ